MGFILTLILICILITVLSYCCSRESHLINAVTGLIISFCLSAFLVIVVWASSYNSFLDMQQNLATVEQYGSAVQIYAEKGVAEFKPGSGRPSEFTDLKYQNYQGQIGKMITDLRRHVTDYNEELVGKQLMKKNWFFSWCIIMPNNDKIIKMKDYLN